MRRICCLLLAVCMLGNFSAFAADENSLSDTKQDDFIINMDFEDFIAEKDNSGFGLIVGNSVGEEKVDEQHGKSIRLSPSPTVTVYKNFPEPISEGVYLLSFDFRCTTNNGVLTYMKLFNEKFGDGPLSTDLAGYTYNTFTALSDGRLGFYNHPQSWTPSVTIKYQPDTWYTIDMWIYADEKNVAYYQNGEYLGSGSLSAIDYKSLNGFIIPVSGDGSSYIDNITFESVNSVEKARKVAQRGKNVPADLITSPKISAETENVGNIFVKDEKISFDVSIFNSEAYDAEFKVTYKAVDDDMRVVWSQEENISIKAAETVKRQIEPKTDKFNVYKFVVTAEDVKTGYSNEIKRDFSRVNAPPEGRKNEHLWVNVHSGNEYGDQEKYMPIADIGGFGGVRDSLLWNKYETANGEYGADKFGQYFNRFMDLKRSLGMDLLLEISPYNWSKYNITYKTMHHTDEQIELLKKMIRYFASNNKDVIWYEFANEVNLVGLREVSFENFVRILKAVDEALAESNPDAKLVVGATATADWQWIEQVIKHGGGPYIDAVSVHPYEMGGSPEEKRWIDSGIALENMLKRNNMEHCEIWGTETAYAANLSGVITQDEGYAYAIRQNLINASHNFVYDKVVIYNLQRKSNLWANNENTFGLIEHWQGRDVTYAARPEFLAQAFWNNLMTDAVFVKQHGDNDNKYAYQFKLDSGKDALILHSVDSIENIAVDLGLDSIDTYDIFGNKETLYAVGGKFQISLENDPIYLVGEFDSVKLSESAVSMDKTYINAPGEWYDFKISSPYDIKYEIKAPYGSELRSSEAVDGGVKAVFDINEDALRYTDEYNWVIEGIEYMEVSGYRDDKLCYRANIPVEYVRDPIDIKVEILPYNSKSENHWQIVVDLTNSTPDALSGKFEIYKPEVIKTIAGGEVSFENLMPGETKQIKINVPLSMNFVKGEDFDAQVTLSDGRIIPLQNDKKLYFTAIPKTDNPPTLDGKIEEGEWDDAQIFPFDPYDERYKYNKWSGPEDFSGVAYAKWDEEYFYVAGDMIDDSLVYDQISKYITLDDHFQIGFTVADKGVYHNSPPQNIISFAYSKYHQKAVFDRLSSGAHMARDAHFESEKTDVVMSRDGNRIIYEVKLEWADLAPVKPVVGTNIEIGINYFDRDHISDTDISRLEVVYTAEDRYKMCQGTGVGNACLTDLRK